MLASTMAPIPRADAIEITITRASISTAIRILSIVDLLFSAQSLRPAYICLCTLDTSLYSCASSAPLALLQRSCQYLALPDGAMKVEGNALVRISPLKNHGKHSGIRE